MGIKETAARIYQERQGTMFKVALEHTGNVHDAEEIVQEAGERMFSQRTIPSNEGTFARVIAHREAHRFLKHQQQGMRDVRRTELLGLTNTHYSPQTLSAEEVVVLRETIREANPYARALGEGYTGREIAQVTGQRENIVYDRAEDWRERQRGGARTPKKPRREVLQAVENFEVFWTGTPLNDFRRAEGLPEITQEELDQKRKKLTP